MDKLIIAAVIVGVGGVLFLQYATRDALRKANEGFGPEWECTDGSILAEPVCIKRREAAKGAPEFSN
jgi:hypothetical protein